jgi:hypothetical protein
LFLLAQLRWSVIVADDDMEVEEDQEMEEDESMDEDGNVSKMDSDHDEYISLWFSSR